MWIGNPPDSTRQPTRGGLQETGHAPSEILMLPPAWRVDVVPSVSGQFPESPVHSLLASVESVAPLNQIQRVRWTDPAPIAFDWNPDLNNVPSGGNFSLSFTDKVSPGLLSHDATCQEIEAHLFGAARLAGIPRVNPIVTRDQFGGLEIRLQQHGNLQCQFPALRVTNQVTGGGIINAEAAGGFVLARRLDYYNNPITPPPDPSEFDPQTYAALLEWHESPYLYEEGGNLAQGDFAKVWYRSTRETTFGSSTGRVSPNPEYWQLGYQLEIGWNASIGFPIISPNWILLLHREVQKNIGPGVGWRLQQIEDMLTINKPVRFGGKTMLYPTDETQDLQFSSEYREMPNSITLTPVW